MINKKILSLKNIVHQTLLIICGLLLGISIYYLNAQKVVGNELPMPFGYGAAVVLSGSMNPYLSVDDLIVVQENTNYEIGDVVVYQYKDILIVHRIVAIDDKFITTKGDANTTADIPVDISMIKGKVIYTVPFVGIIINFLKTAVGILCTLGLSILLIEFPRRKDKLKNTIKKQQLIEEIEQLKNEIRSEIK